MDVRTPREWYTRLLLKTRAMMLAIESQCNRVFSGSLNPFYYHGALPTVAFWTLILSGLLLFAYYVPTLEQAYDSVKYITEEVPYGRMIRSFHRYAADVMMVAVLLHMLRVFVTNRHRKSRHFVWVTGGIMFLTVVILGVSGYIMAWDERGLALTRLTTRILGQISPGLARGFLGGHEITDRTLSRALFFHLGFSLIIFFFMWTHFLRITRPIITMPIPLILTLVGLILGLAAVFPIEMESPAILSQAIDHLEVDWFFLGGYWLFTAVPGWLFWAMVVGGFGLLFALPYLSKEPMTPAVVYLDKCVGCWACAWDCPYEAIEMFEMVDVKGKRRMKARVLDNRCVECGICVGSCDFESIDIPSLTEAQVLDRITAMVGDSKEPVA